MKFLAQYPIGIYVLATIASLSIMILVDFILGPEAEHLNAWALANKLFESGSNLPDSLAIRKLGLPGATSLTLLINIVMGVGLIQLIRAIIYTIKLL